MRENFCTAYSNRKLSLMNKKNVKIFHYTVAVCIVYSYYWYVCIFIGELYTGIYSIRVSYDFSFCFIHVHVAIHVNGTGAHCTCRCKNDVIHYS